MSVRRNVIANYVSSAWTALIGLAMLPMYLRFLGIESYGLIGFFLTLQAWLSLLDLGLNPTLNREMARFSAGLRTPQGIHDLLRSMEMVYAGVAVLLAGTVALTSAWIATGWLNLQTIPPDAAAQALAIMGLAFGIQWIGTLYRSAILGLQDQVWLSAATVATTSGRAAGTVAVLAFLSPTITAFVVFQCAVSLAETSTLAWRVHRLLPRPPRAARFSLEALREVWQFAAGMALIAVLATFLTQVDKLLLAWLLPLDQFGYFSLAVAVAGALSIVIGPIHNVAYPRLSELVAAGNPQPLAQAYHRFAQLLSIAVLPVALVLAVFAPEIVLLWTQDALTAQQVAPIVSVWAIGTALNGIMHMPYAAQLAHGWARLTVTVNAVAVAIIVPATLYLVPRYGAIAAAWVWVGINAGYAVFSVAVMHTRILTGEKWRWYLQDLLAPLAPAALVMMAFSLLHDRLGPLARGTELAFLVLALAAATLSVVFATGTGQAMAKAALTQFQRPRPSR